MPLQGFLSAYLTENKTRTIIDLHCHNNNSNSGICIPASIAFSHDSATLAVRQYSLNGYTKVALFNVQTGMQSYGRQGLARVGRPLRDRFLSFCLGDVPLQLTAESN